MPKIKFIDENLDPKTKKPRPRFNPSGKLRNLGYTRHNLKNEDGTWFTMGQAREYSQAIDAEAKVKEIERKANIPHTPRRRRTPPVYTLGQLIHDWQSPSLNPRFSNETITIGLQTKNPLAKRTIRGYRQMARVIEQECITAWASPAIAFDNPIIKGMYDHIWQKRGVHTANACARVLSAAFAWGIKNNKIKMGADPAKNIGLTTPPPRERAATIEEIDTLVSAADQMGLPEIGDMILLGAWTGQRQGDRLIMGNSQIKNGRITHTQNKTGTKICIKLAPILARRLKKAQERRKHHTVAHDHLIIDERRQCPLNPSPYTTKFEKVRELAATGDVSYYGEKYTFIKPVKAIATLTDQDLRSTAVTWLSSAGVDITGICAITGHSLKSNVGVLHHYLKITQEMSDNAIDQMVAWYEKQQEPR